VQPLPKEWLDALPAADEVRARERWRTCAVVGRCTLCILLTHLLLV
jgi:hypothetical protein